MISKLESRIIFGWYVVKRIISLWKNNYKQNNYKQNNYNRTQRLFVRKYSLHKYFLCFVLGGYKLNM